jgi:hypothetical protein
VSFYITPLKEVIYHYIWDEKAIVAINSESDRIRVQDELKVYISVLPNSPVGISEGFATIYISNDKLGLLNNQSKIFATPKIQTPAVLSGGKPISFIGIAPGETQINVEIKTRYNKFRGEKIITVIDDETDGAGFTKGQLSRPSTRNFSGEWNIRIGSNNGKMMVSDKLGNITGSYTLDNNIHGVISGVRDGGIFYASLYRQSPELKWEVSATTKVSDGFLLIEGKATLQKIGSGKWVSTDQTDTFIAAVQLLDR